MKVNIKRKKYLFVWIIVTTMIVFLGTTFAFIRFTTYGNKTYTIVGGELKLDIDDSNNNLTIGDINAVPVSDFVGLRQDGYNFQISNTGKAKIKYSITIENNDENTMNDNAIRYAIKKDSDSEYKIADLDSVVDRVLSDGIIEKDEVIGFNLKFWIKEEATNDMVVNKTFSVRLKVDGEQIIGIPDGNIEEPNSIDTLLATLSNNNKKYNTINDILADTELTESLLTDENSVNYILRSEDWIDEFTSNENAMTVIGNNDELADKFLDDDSWHNSILNSEYFEKVLNVKVPIMTSNTEP